MSADKISSTCTITRREEGTCTLYWPNSGSSKDVYLRTNFKGESFVFFNHSLWQVNLPHDWDGKETAVTLQKDAPDKGHALPEKGKIMAKRAAIYLSQSLNMKYDTRNPKPEEPEYIYNVTKVINSTVVHVGQVLYPSAVDGMITEGWNVTITE